MKNIMFQDLIEFCDQHRELAKSFLKCRCMETFPGNVHRYEVYWGKAPWREEGKLFSFAHFGWEGKPLPLGQLLERKSSKRQNNFPVRVPEELRKFFWEPEFWEPEESI